MANMVPMGAKQSMLLEPSRGSKHTTYFPCEQRHTDIIHLLMESSNDKKVTFKYSFQTHSDFIPLYHI